MGNYYDKIDRKPIVASGEDEGPSGLDYFISVTGDEKVSLLSRVDPEAGLTEYRQNGEWVPVTNPKLVPELDIDQTEVGESATEIWDAAQGEGLTLADFEDTITD